MKWLLPSIFSEMPFKTLESYFAYIFQSLISLRYWKNYVSVLLRCTSTYKEYRRTTLKDCTVSLKIVFDVEKFTELLHVALFIDIFFILWLDAIEQTRFTLLRTESLNLCDIGFQSHDVKYPITRIPRSHSTT